MLSLHAERCPDIEAFPRLLDLRRDLRLPPSVPGPEIAGPADSAWLSPGDLPPRPRARLGAAVSA